MERPTIPASTVFLLAARMTNNVANNTVKLPTSSRRIASHLSITPKKRDNNTVIRIS